MVFPLSISGLFKKAWGESWLAGRGIGMGMGIFLFELLNLVRGGGTLKNGSGDEGIGSGKEVEVEVGLQPVSLNSNKRQSRQINPSLPSLSFPPHFPQPPHKKTQNPKPQNPNTNTQKPP